MSWDYNLLIGFEKDKLPYDFAMDTASVIYHNPIFKGINSVIVYRNSKIKYSDSGDVSSIPIIKLETQTEILSFSDVAEILSKSQQDNVLIEMSVVVPRYGRMGIKTELEGWDYDTGEVVQRDENVIISIFAKQFNGYPKDLTGGNAAGAIYNARNGDKYNVQRSDEVGYKNIHYVVNELINLVPCGIVSITALDRENGRDARTSSLKFYQRLFEFIEDIGGESQRSLKAYSDLDVLATAAECDDIEFLHTKPGMLVYSKQGIAGNLSHFYDSLSSRLNV